LVDWCASGATRICGLYKKAPGLISLSHAMTDTCPTGKLFEVE
jgi:hypothetical protein